MTRWPAYLVIVGALTIVQVAVSDRLAAANARSPTPAAPIDGDEEAGRDLYVENCRACHSGAIAPALKGVAGRAIASVPQYAFSDALKAKSAKTWTTAELDAFLADPKGYAPGTKMGKSVTNAQERVDIIAYLQAL